MDRLNVVCVLRSGGDFDPRWVRALKRGVEEYLSLEHRFICLTDWHFDGCVTYLLEHEWPGWWAKTEMFRPGLFQGRVLYMDLDTLPVGSLDEIASYSGDFACLSDFFSPRHIASGVLAFRPSDATGAIYRQFVEDPLGIVRQHPHRMDHWLRKVFPDEDRLQDLFGSQIVSLKGGEKKGRLRKGIPEGARLVAGHGQPRLSSPDAGWAYTLWKERATQQEAS